MKSSLLVIALASLLGCGLGYSYKTEWFETKVDHFGYGNNDTFQMRYLFNDDHFDSTQHKPVVFFYAGNEGDIESFANNSGLMWDWAPEFKALLVFAEHRFYGQSMPYGNKSYSDPKYYGYLTVEQALADYADFLFMMGKRFAPNSKIVAFGGSYGGMLAAWMRIKYPWLIDAALASSAPILQFQDVTPCEAYNLAVTKPFALEGQKCADNIRKSWIALENKAKTGTNGLDFVRANFKLCQKIDASNYTAVRDWLYDSYGNLAMMNYPYSTDFIKKVPGHPVRESCKFLQNDFASDDDLLRGIYQAMNVFHNFSGNVKCNDLNGANGALSDDGWNVQTCNEMVMPFCGDGKTDMFYPYAWNFDQFRAKCEKKYRITPDLYKAQTTFGAKDIRSASNIVFTNGDIDPWSSGGVLHSLGHSLPSILIKGGAHHYDLRARHPLDTKEVIHARQLAKMYIRKWIHERH